MDHYSLREGGGGGINYSTTKKHLFLGVSSLFVSAVLTEPAISDDLITKHYISLNTFLFY